MALSARFYKAFTSEERGYTHRQKRKEVSAMGFALNAAEDLEDLIYECKEVSASER